MDLATSIHQMTGVELDYAYAKANNWNIMGWPNGPFALCANSPNQLMIFGNNSENIVLDASFSGSLSEFIFDDAVKLGASICVKDGLVHCQIPPLSE